MSTKSSAKDLSSAIFWLLIVALAEAIVAANKALGKKSSRSSMDSGLEAFSHNPTHGSFSPLPVRAGENTKYANQRFLSY